MKRLTHATRILATAVTALAVSGAAIANTTQQSKGTGENGVSIESVCMTNWRIADGFAAPFEHLRNAGLLLSWIAPGAAVLMAPNAICRDYTIQRRRESSRQFDQFHPAREAALLKLHH